MEILDSLKGSGFYTRIARFRRLLGDFSKLRLLNERILKVCLAGKFDVIWIFKGVEVLPETLNELRKNGVCTANFNPDHPKIRTSFTHGGRNVEECVPLYDFYFTYNRSLSISLANNGVWLPFAYELEPETFEQLDTRNELTKVCFVGTVDAERLKILKILNKQGFPIDIFGSKNRFSASLRGKSIETHNAVFGSDFWQVLRSYRVQLNLFRRHNIDSHNQRTFEVPAVGGVLLTPFSEEQALFFEVGTEIECYSEADCLSDKIETLLTLKKQDAIAIRDAAREKSIKSDYSYSARAKFVFDRFREKLLH